MLNARSRCLRLVSGDASWVGDGATLYVNHCPVDRGWLVKVSRRCVRVDVAASAGLNQLTEELLVAVCFDSLGGFSGGTPVGGAKRSANVGTCCFPSPGSVECIGIIFVVDMPFGNAVSHNGAKNSTELLSRAASSSMPPSSTSVEVFEDIEFGFCKLEKSCFGCGALPYNVKTTPLVLSLLPTCTDFFPSSPYAKLCFEEPSSNKLAVDI